MQCRCNDTFSLLTKQAGPSDRQGDFIYACCFFFNTCLGGDFYLSLLSLVSFNKIISTNWACSKEWQACGMDCFEGGIRLSLFFFVVVVVVFWSQMPACPTRWRIRELLASKEPLFLCLFPYVRPSAGLAGVCVCMLCCCRQRLPFIPDARIIGLG